MNRALRAATVGALMLSPLGLGACSAGQVTQTNTQDRDKSGPQVDVAGITMRSVVLAYPSSGRYDVGDDAELTAAIVNTSDQPDTLTSIESDAFEGVRSIGGPASAASSSSGTSSTVDVEIPDNQSVFLGSGDAPTILLENLTEELTAGQGIDMTLTFERAGEVQLRAMVANPSEEVARGEAFDYQQEEQATGADERESSSGAGQGN